MSSGPRASEASESSPSSGVKVIRPGEPFAGRQGIDYVPGISAESAGAKGICLHLLTIPPGGRARPHYHASHETAIYVLSGVAEMWHGEGLREKVMVNAGDFVYIPAGVPHLPANLSPIEPVTALVARTDPNEQESVFLVSEPDQS
jgi:uncharacterized RmlC-like cupin family protein